jgi:hypothetical protein
MHTFIMINGNKMNDILYIQRVFKYLYDKKMTRNRYKNAKRM